MAVVMDADRMGRTLTRIAHEILERNRGVEELALVGIRTRGVPIARRLARAIADINHHEVPTGALDITLYRDDLMRHAVGPQPVVRRTEIPFSIDDKKILLAEELSINESYLWLVNIATGEKTELTPRNTTEKVSYSEARFSKDGKGIYVTSDKDSEFHRLAYIDLATKQSTFVILDADDVSGEPVAVVKLPQRVPIGLHDNWYPAEP